MFWTCIFSPPVTLEILFVLFKQTLFGSCLAVSIYSSALVNNDGLVCFFFGATDQTK